ncbi:MAG: tRNA-intron endonuclease [Patescibacteria group bacterium]|jgi:tRNA-intron endonuclease
MQKVKALLVKSKIFSNTVEAHTLFEKSRFGEKDNDRIVYMPEEAYYLQQTGKMQVLTSTDKEMSTQELYKKLSRANKRFPVRSATFNDLRKKAFIPKSALKYGADFRVYPKGSKIEKAHSKWIAYCDTEEQKITWHDFAAKNRVAHSTKKNLLICIVDNENDLSYYEVSWKKII